MPRIEYSTYFGDDDRWHELSDDDVMSQLRKIRSRRTNGSHLAHGRDNGRRRSRGGWGPYPNDDRGHRNAGI